MSSSYPVPSGHFPSLSCSVSFPLPLKRSLFSTLKSLSPLSPWDVPLFVTLRCFYSGSLNRGNTFPSKLLLKGKKRDSETSSGRLFSLCHPEMSLSPSCHPERFLRRVSGEIRDSSVATLHQNDRLSCHPERLLRALFLGMHYAKWVSFLISCRSGFLKRRKTRLWNECLLSVGKGVQSDWLFCHPEVYLFRVSFLFLYQGTP